MIAPSPLIAAEAAWRLDAGKYRLRVEDYLLLDRAGSFYGIDTELVDGDVIVMSPEWRPHFRIKSELFYRLRQAVSAAELPFFVGTEGSIALSDTDMPRPDLVLTDDADGEGAVPRESVPLVVEISSTTLHEDLGVKAARYAEAGIAEYWVVDVSGRVIHRHWTPSGGEYAEHDIIRFGELLTAATLISLTVDTAGL